MSSMSGSPRRYPSTTGGIFYLIVLAVAGLAMAVIVWGSWRTGVKVLGVDLLGAAFVRAILPERDAGMLGVRSKPVDVVLLVGVGVLLIYLAFDIPA